MIRVMNNQNILISGASVAGPALAYWLRRRGFRQARGGQAFLAPATARKIRQRNRTFAMLPYLPVQGLIRYLSTRTATAITLPAYPDPDPDPDPAAGSR
jgi:hypothetical protein